MLRLGVAIGVEPDKWLRRFSAGTSHGRVDAHYYDDPVAHLLDESVDVALVRLPDERISDAFHVIHIYEEAAGIAVPKESVYAEVGSTVKPHDIEDEIINFRISPTGEVDTAELRTALQVVAANVGVAIAPRPALKVLSGRQITHLAYSDVEYPDTSIAVVFFKHKDNDVIQDFVGITKGRTIRSSRQNAPKRTARQKALDKQKRMQKGRKKR